MKKRALILIFGLSFLWMGTLVRGEELPPSKGQKSYDQAVALMEKGDFDGALPKLENAIELDKELAAAYYALAVCQARKKNPDTAAARKRHQEAVALGYQYNEWLETYCDQLDKQKAAPK